MTSAVSPVVTSVCLRLATEWLRCASSIAEKGAALSEAVERLRVIESMARSDVAAATAGRATLMLSAETANVSARIAIPLGVSDTWLARALSGCMRQSGARETTIALLRSTGLSVHLGVTSVDESSEENGANRCVRIPTDSAGSTALARPLFLIPLPMASFA